MLHRDSVDPKSLAFPSPIAAGMRHTLQFGLLLLTALLLSACGGGGGSNRAAAAPPAPAPQPDPTGSVAVSIVDELDAPVINATVTVTVDGVDRSGTTSDLGVATIDSVPVGDGEIAVAADDFQSTTQMVTVTEDQQVDVATTLTRITEPATILGNVELTTPLASTDGQTLTFSVEVLVVNDDLAAPSAIDNLTAADFTLQACSDNDSNRTECLRAGGGQSDTGYSVVSATPANFAVVPGQPAQSFAASSTIDQSGSIETNDPSDARLYSNKVFLNNLRAGDFASISAFAQQGGTSGPALIADEPVTRLSEFIQGGDAQSVFADLDELATQEGGGTPLFAALDQEIDYTAANAPAGIDRRVVVLFTDGDDSICDPPNTAPCGIDVSTQKSIDLGVDIFTVGLGTNLSVDRLQRLARGGNGLFLYAESPAQLIPIYRALGELLSGTQASYRMEWTISADEAATYAAGQTILGTLSVDTGNTINNLPIRVFL